MDSIKFVYFDVGGVCLLDYSGTNKWTEMKRSLGITQETDTHFESVWEKYEERVCVDCDIDTFLPELRQIRGSSIPEDYSMLQDFVNRFEKNSSMWPVIEAAKGQYRVGLLTNMFPRMLDNIMKQNLIPQIEWDTIIDSTQVGYQKPHPMIYQIAEKVAGVKPEEVFFIDNMQENVNEASKRGWKTFHYDSTKPEGSSKELSSILGL